MSGAGAGGGAGAGASQARLPAYCHVCGSSLGAKYYRYEHGLVVCATCQATRPRCARCGVPVADGQQTPHLPAQGTRGGPLCRRCLRTAPRCACCGEPIAQTWYTFEELLPPASVRRYCEQCVRERPRCDICRAPVPRSAVVLPDGQYRCALCATEMVLDESEARALYDEALRLAERTADVRPRVVPALVVVGRRQMGEVRRRFPHTAEPDGSDGQHGPHVQHVLGFFVREGRATSIYVELGLPRPLLLGTLAHELAHAWQVEVAPGVSDPLLREGFAEWVAHRVLVAGGHRPVAARATRRDDLYGRGLRHFLAIERASGARAVLAAARGEPAPAIRTAPGGRHA